MFFFNSMRARHVSDGSADHCRAPSQPLSEPTGVLQKARHFTESRAGNVSIIFGLMAVPFISFAGLSIDFAAAAREKSKIQTALDAAALAAGRAFQVTGSDGDAKAAAALYFKKQTGYDLTVNNVDQSTFVLTVGSQESIDTSFMGVLGSSYDQLTVNALSKAQLVREIQGDAVEVSMMLDITGSMGRTVTGCTGSRMDELKTAATDLVNILIKHQDDNVRVALAPFSHTVNVGGKFKKWTGQDPVDGMTCVVERLGANRFTDAAPTNANGKFQPLPTAGAGYYNCPSSTAFWLSSNKNALINRINQLPTHGNTAGHLGTQWAWYLISKNWHNQWGNARRRPSATMDGVKKIAVLMSDGQYNNQWNKGSPHNDTNLGSDSQAGEICDNMKADGIIVYAVGFELSAGSSAYNRLEDCASTDEHFFPAATGSELKAAFREIAFTIAELRLVE